MDKLKMHSPNLVDGNIEKIPFKLIEKAKIVAKF